MNILLKLVTLSLILVMRAFAENEPILYCPSTIECSIKSSYSGTKDCHLSNNPYHLWVEPSISATSYPNTFEVKEGIYPLKEVSLGINSYFLGETSCKYESSGFSFLIHLNQKVLNKFTPLENNNSKWSKKNSSVFKCYSNDTTMCPMKEDPEIVINHENFSGLNYPYFYITNPNELPGDYFIAYNRLTYDKLLHICGVTSNCIIDIGDRSYVESNDGFRHLGTVDLDIATPNVVKINNILTDEWIYIMFHASNHEPLFKKINPFNTVGLIVW